MPESREADEARVFRELVAATKDITSPRYNYFCYENEAKEAWNTGGDEVITVAMSLLEVNITPPKGNDPRDKIKQGAIDSVIIDKATKTGITVRPKNSKGKKKHQAFVREYMTDIAALNVLNASIPIDFVSFAEFAFPFPLGSREGPWYKGDDHVADDDSGKKFKELLKAAVLAKSFACLGSAHRNYRHMGRSPTRKEHNNIAYVYPVGIDGKWGVQRKALLEAKFTKEWLPESLSTHGVTMSLAADGHMTCRVVIEDVDIGPSSSRGDFFNDANFRKLKICKAETYRLVESVFDFVDSLEMPVRHNDFGTQFLTFKQNAAKKMREYLDRQGRSELELFVTKKGVVSVLICYDSFDPTMFLSAIRLQKESKEFRWNHPNVDLFIVPAYNPSKAFVNACQSLSKMTDSTVIYLNSHPKAKNDKAVDFRIFISGADVLDDNYWTGLGLPDNRALEAHKKRYIKRHIIPGRPHLRVYSISKNLLMSARKGNVPTPDDNTKIVSAPAGNLESVI